MEAEALHAEPFYADPRFWVAVAFVAFFIIFGRILWRALAGALDGRAVRIGAELEEASRLRNEAEALLVAYKQKYEASVQEAAAILTHAREEAELLVKQSQEEIKTLISARTRLAEEKIAQAEKKTLEDARQHVIDITINTARTLISENMAHISDDAPLRAALADLERKVH